MMGLTGSWAVTDKKGLTDDGTDSCAVTDK